jgi:hypothetical protein
MLETPFDHLLDAPHPLVYSCAKGSPKIDGRIHDAAWESAAWTEDFTDIEGAKRPVPRFRTRAKMLWDERYFYVSAQLWEPHVWATLTEHDSVIFHDNDFELFIDPDGDNHNYYEFEINALNTGWDLKLPKPYRDGGPALNEWEIPGLKTAVHVDGTLNDASDLDNGWTVELAIPWEALGGAPSDEDVWRINFSRVEWQVDVVSKGYRKRPGTREDNWVWSPQHVIDMHQPQLWGYVRFDNLPSREEYRDSSHRARMSLHHIYYRQKRFFEQNGRYASRMEQLGISTLPGFLRPPRIHMTAAGYSASGVVEFESGQKLLSIREDSLVRVLNSDP